MPRIAVPLLSLRSCLTCDITDQPYRRGIFQAVDVPCLLLVFRIYGCRDSLSFHPTEVAMSPVLSLLSHWSITTAMIFHSRLYNIFFGNLFTITGHPTPRNRFSLVLWTYHGYGLCCGQSWNSYRSSLGQPYFFQSPCGISAYVAVPLPRFLRFRVNRLMRKREFYFFSFSCRQAVVVADEEFTFYADSQPFSCLSDGQARSYLVSRYRIQELSLIFSKPDL